MKNSLTCHFTSISENEGLARMIAASFIAPYDPTVGELSDIKTVVSEAVTNAVIHGYNEEDFHEITLKLHIEQRLLTIEIIDEGKGMEKVEQAMEPLYTSRPDMERSGMGFTIMEHFMDQVEVRSASNQGTTVKMVKQLSAVNANCL
ncbi:anti-sigma F factor [Jeotgalibacillus terrae]|uniref:Anti-sigma F factor n=1 Tax=Jeotgalibacillus terrae TaxID=587735 RepID=A0ABW5ZL86_9BACL|nr:anti-sigma F factor [Jeotgalibacillus terrae]MBM7577486.1 stage II sporulation protein AB (anti-sigma F factor) [Jeotgalibacillus terrae]